MKRRIVILIIIFVLATSLVVNAEASRIQISMNGNRVSVMRAPIIINGKMMSTQVPSFVHNDRTLVHIRFIEENSDAKVTWNGKNETITVDFEENQVILSIDQATATINGEKRILDKGSIPRLVKYEGEVNSRTMVPLSFLAEALGFEVGWDYVSNNAYINSKKDEEKEEPEEVKEEDKEEKEKGLEKSTINSIGIFNGSTDKNKLIIKSDKKLSYTLEHKKEENKLIIDMTGSKLQLNNTKDAPGVINVNDDFIKEIRFSQLEYSPYITRIVMDLKKYKEPNIITTSDGTGLMVSFETKRIGKISKEVIDGKEGIVISGGNKENMKIMKLHDPERLVIDLLDSTLEGEPYIEYPFDLGFIEKVRVSQFTADNNYSQADQIVRLVIDVKGKIEDPNIKIDSLEDKIVIYPEKSVWENIELETIERNRILTIKNIINTKYNIDYDNAIKNLQITLPSEATELSSGLIIVKDNLIDEIEVVEKGGFKEITVRFIKSIEYKVLSNETDREISILIERNKNLKPEDRLIVIDPGHGGKDPGAISVTKKKEKDFNLTVSKKFDEKLKALGYNTIMTRDTDVFVDLYERPRIANDNYADIFISIHANAFSNNSAIEGIEVLYCPSNNSNLKREDQHPLSKIMLEELLKGTGAKSRGIIKRPKLVVLRGSIMPAVLVEAGFLTNYKEEELLFTESYQDIIVDSMVRAVVEYFEID